MLTLHLFRCSLSVFFVGTRWRKSSSRRHNRSKTVAVQQYLPSSYRAKLHDPTYAWTPWWPHPEQKWWIKRKYKTKNILNIIAGHVGISQINFSCKLILGVLILDFKMSLYNSDIHIQQRVTSFVTSFLFNSKSIKKKHPCTVWHVSRNSSIVTTPSLLRSIFWVQTEKLQ